MKPAWDQLRKEYKDAGNVLIGDVDCTVHQQLCSDNGVKGYPTIMVLKANGQTEPYNGGREFPALKSFVETSLAPRPGCTLEAKDACSAADLKVLEASEALSKSERAKKVTAVQAEVEAKRAQAKQLQEESKRLEEELALIKLGGEQVEKVEQMLNDDDTRAHCEGRTCIIAFLPHILDDQAAGRNAHVKVLDGALSASKKGPSAVGFLWSQGGDQFELEEALGLAFGFPAVVAVNFKKARFGVLRGTFDKAAIESFLTSLGRGGVPLSPLPTVKITKAEPWDGKDGVLPTDDEF